MSRMPLPADWEARADEAVRRGERLDSYIPRFLFDRRVSFLGYAYGCVVGWVWGSLLSTGPVERHHGLWVFRGLPNWAFPRGGVCVGNCFLMGDDAIDERVMHHEAVHMAQWRHYGILMPILYRIAGRDPLRNRFEITAGLADGRYVPR